MERRSPLFPPWADTVLRIAFATFIGALIAGPTCAMLWVRTAYTTGEANPIRQPLAFDHRHHTRDVGIECRFCHNSVQTSKVAGIPATELCMGCHSQVWNQAPVLAALRESAFTQQPIKWIRVTKLPDHVFFNHSIHVNRGVGCVSCHGRVDLMGQVYAQKPLTMSWCLDCHRDPEKNLRPLDKVTSMDWVASDPRKVGHEVAQSLGGVHPPVTTCTGCHR